MLVSLYGLTLIYKTVFINGAENLVLFSYFLASCVSDREALHGILKLCGSWCVFKVEESNFALVIAIQSRNIPLLFHGGISRRYFSLYKHGWDI